VKGGVLYVWDALCGKMVKGIPARLPRRSNSVPAIHCSRVFFERKTGQAALGAGYRGSPRADHAIE
jgi:hypothetical protein